MICFVDQKNARRIVVRLNNGENFIALAQAESIDPTAAAGGFGQR